VSRRPLIGLPGRRTLIGKVDGFPRSLDHLDADLYFADYARGVLEAGGMPVHIPLDVDPSEVMHHLDGLVLTGGADVDPSRYGRENEASVTEQIRDEIEFGLLDAALSVDVPVLGICRGLQLLNVHAGGSLHQHVPEHARYDIDPSVDAHLLTIEPDTELWSLFGAQHRVNSLHHQTVDRVGGGLVVSARSEDGTIEAVEMDGHPVIAVQWHPELMTTTDPVFAWLVERARRG
jgi:putative glutamine amidotransferase